MGFIEVLSSTGQCFLLWEAMACMALLTLLSHVVTSSAWPCCTLFCDPKENIYISFASVPGCKKGKISLPSSLPESPLFVLLWGRAPCLIYEGCQRWCNYQLQVFPNCIEVLGGGTRGTGTVFCTFPGKCRRGESLLNARRGSCLRSFPKGQRRLSSLLGMVSGSCSARVEMVGVLKQ